MTSILKTSVLGLAILATVPACTNKYDPLQRTAAGALIGAGAGAAIGAAAGGGPGAALGAAVGGVAGAATGYATTPAPPRQRPSYYHSGGSGSTSAPPPGY